MDEMFNNELLLKIQQLESEFAFQTANKEEDDIIVDDIFDGADEEDEDDIYDEMDDGFDYYEDKYIDEESEYELMKRGESSQMFTRLGTTQEEKNQKKSADQVSEDDIDKYAYLLYPEKKIIRSRIPEIFTLEQLIELYKINDSFSISNNDKVKVIKDLLNEWGIKNIPLGTGTNRYGFSTDGYVVKIAADEDGKIDNKREFIYSMDLQPYVIKCYEITEDGLIGIFEYVDAFSIQDFWSEQEEMRKILRKIANNYLIGDVGITNKNYGNWGHRNDGSCVILDFAYIYSVSFNHFSCSCNPNSILYYDEDFVNFICPNCNKTYTFSELRRRISRAEQDAEIGDVTKKGYVVTKPEQLVKFRPRFTMGASEAIADKILKNNKRESQKKSKKSQNYRKWMNETAGKHVYGVKEIIQSMKENGGI